MSIIFTSKSGEKIDIKKDMKYVKLPDGSTVLESPSIAIPRILKRKYPELYVEYLNAVTERKRRLHNIHLNIKR